MIAAPTLCIFVHSQSDSRRLVISIFTYGSTRRRSLGDEGVFHPAPGDLAFHVRAIIWRGLSNAILLTAFIKHDQSLNLTEIQKLQEEQGFWKAFPPQGTAVVSWDVLMGIGQVRTLQLPAGKLGDVNITLEKTAWKAFRTEFYPTYDLYPIIKDKLANPRKSLREEENGDSLPCLRSVFSVTLP